MEKEFSFVTEALSNSYIQCYPGEAAQELTQLAVEDIKTFLKNRPPHHVTAIVEHLPLEVASDVIEEADESFVKKTLSKLDPLRVGMILARLDADQQKKTLACLDPKRAGLIKTIMTYPLDSAGGIMNPQFLGMLPDSTVGEVLLKLRSLKKQKVSEIVVQDPKGHIQGLVPLQQLVAAPQTQSLATLYHGRPITVHVMASRQDVVDVMEKTKINTLPVVDLEDRVFGVIQQDTLFETAQEEASADIQMMVGVSKEERALSKVSFAVRKRLPWLQINLLTAFLAAAVVGLFESTIAQFTALAVLLPVVAGQSGNTGAQALAVTMRGLTLREIRVYQWFQVLFKETRVGFLNGCAVALTTSLAVFVWSQSAGLAMIIGIAMVFSMVAAGISGVAVPMILISFGQDPAQSSSIILTTITDVVGFFSFLGMATLLASTI